MAQCGEISLLLGAFEDGELEPHEMKEVATHMAACKACELAYNEIAGLGMMLRDAAAVPDLNGFSAAVSERVARMRPSMPVRMVHRLDRYRSRIGTSARFAAAMAIAAAVTVMISLPLGRKFDARRIIPWNGATHSAGYQQASMPVADNAGALDAQTAQAQDTTSANTADIAAASASDDTSAVISKLETPDPNVAVWSEPRNDTTVIWLPDQP